MFVALVIVTVVVFLIIRGASGSKQGILALETNGLPARGLVLACDRVSTGRTINGRRFETFSMTLDVEPYGAAPYVCTGSYLVPRGQVETVPGASLELMVDRKNKNQLLVIGPGGFSGPWLRAQPPNAY
ncbi:MAG: hypothetical protein ABI548_20185 [Polyangiaceae bacterium]